MNGGPLFQTGSKPTSLRPIWKPGIAAIIGTEGAAIRQSLATYDADFQMSLRTELAKGARELGSNPADYDLADESIVARR